MEINYLEWGVVLGALAVMSYSIWKSFAADAAVKKAGRELDESFRKIHREMDEAKAQRELNGYCFRTRSENKKR